MKKKKQNKNIKTNDGETEANLYNYTNSSNTTALLLL